MTTAGPITPDTKDWTWVLDKPCPECGYDASTVAVADLAHRIRANAVVWLALMGEPDVTVRPEPGVWSPLEYACHVHDVHQVFHERLTAMMTEHEPHFANWDQDTTAVERRYDQQVPAIVGPTLVASAYAVGDLYASVPDDDWGRKGIRSDGSVFNIASLGRYHLHDIEHHLHDVATMAERVTIGSYDAYAGEYASGTSAMPDEVTHNLNHFVDLVGTEARVLEIGSGPGRDAAALEQIGLSVRRTDITPRLRRPAPRCRLPRRPARPAPRRPHRHAAGRGAVRRRLGQRVPAPRRPGSAARGARPPGRRHPARRHAPPDPQGGDGAGWSVHGHVGAPRFFTYWREDPLRAHLTEAGWVVDDVRRGDSTPLDRPSESWLAVFATRA